MYFRLIGFVFRLGLWLGALGSLVDVTRILVNDMGHTKQLGLISLTELNQSLQGKSPGR